MPFRLGKLTSLENFPFFVVGPNEGGSIEELCLNRIGGRMEVKGLEKVSDKEAAERANLKMKTKIHGLDFN